METVGQYETLLGILDARITISAEVNEYDEDKYNQLVIDLGQRMDSAFSQEIKIPHVTREQVLELSRNLEKLAKYFPKE